MGRGLDILVQSRTPPYLGAQYNHTFHTPLKSAIATLIAPPPSLQKGAQAVYRAARAVLIGGGAGGMGSPSANLT